MNTLPQFSAPNTGAIRFADVDNESVSVAHDAALSAANWTVEAWITTTNTDADLNRVLVKPVGGNQTYSIIVVNGEAQILSNVGVVTSTGVTVADGVPHHIAGVFDSVAETLTLYVDGALISSASTAGQTLLQGTEDVFIGDFPGGVVEAFDGDISDVRIWSDVRTTEEIAATFDQSLDGGAPNLELHLRFDGDVTDSSGNGRDGVINGAPPFVEGLAPVDPVAFAPSPLTATEDLPKAITGLQVSDADPGAVLTVTLEAAFGGLTLGTTTGLTFTLGANGDPFFAVEGSVADLNAALSMLSYLGDPEFSGVDDIILTVDDGEPEVVEPVAGAQVIPNSGTFFFYDFDTGIGFTAAQAGGIPANAPTNGVYININPNNNEWGATAFLVENGVTTFLSPANFTLVGYAGGSSISGNAVRFEDAITGLTLTYTNEDTPTPTGARDITFTFNGLDFADAFPGNMNLDDADFRMSSEAVQSIPVTVAPANDAPFAANDMIVADEDNIVTGDLFADNGLGVDFDIDVGDIFNVIEIDGVAVVDGEVVTLASGANLTIRADGTFDYDPNGQFEFLGVGATASDGFTYTITDGNIAPDEAITGALGIPAHATFVVDFDTGLTSSELNFGATIPPANGVVIIINPGAGNFEVVADIFENGVSTSASGDFTLIGYVGASGPTVGGQRFAFDDAFSDLTLVWQRSGVPSPTGPRDVSFTFEGVTFADNGDGSATIARGVVSSGAPSVSTALVDLTINGVNDAPVAQDDMFASDEDTLISASLFADNGNGIDDDIDGVLLSVTEIDGVAVMDGQMVTTATGAGLVIRSDGTFDYDPMAAFDPLADGEAGIDSFTYTITDDQGATSTAIASFNITGVNDAPIAADDIITTDEDTIVTGSLLDDNGFGPDLDIDNGTILAVTEIDGIPVLDGEVVPLPSGAQLTIRTDGSFDYNPSGAFEDLGQGQTATESFTYTIMDDFGATSIATAFVTVTGVNDAPTAFDDNIVVDEDTVFSGSLFADNGFGADVDVEVGSMISVTEINGAPVTDGQAVTLASGAILTIRANGTYDYDPNGAFEQLAQGETQPDIFAYTIADEFGANATATAFITVNGVNDAPVAADDNFSTDQNNVLAGDLFADNFFGPDIDPDNGAFLSIAEIDGIAVFDGEPVVLPSGAILLIRADGTFDYDPNGAFDTLPEGATAPDSFTYTIADEFGATSTATANVTVFGANDAPLAFDETFDLDEGMPISGNLFLDSNSDGDLAFDPDGDLLIVSQINGAMVANGDVIALPSGSLLTIRTDGTFDYAPQGQFNALAAGATATDSFTYQIDDGFGGVSTATANLNITGVNDAPVALPDDFGTAANAPISGDLTADNGFGADLDVDIGDILSVIAINGQAVSDGQIVTLASGANLIIRSDGTFDYDPAGVFDALADGEVVNDAFSYTLSDGQGGTSDATADLFITGVNDPPTATNDSFATDEETPIAGDLFADNGLGPDFDPDMGDILSITEINGAPVIDGQMITLASGANLTIRANGTFDYDPAGVFENLAVGAQANDDFTYTVADELGVTATATAVVAINGVNDAPVALFDDFATAANTPLSGDLTADNGVGADFDIDVGDILSVAAINGQAVFDGQVVMLPSGALLTIRADGTFDYDPAGAFDDLGEGESGTETFTYTLSDGQGGTSDSVAGLFISGVNDPPVAVNDAFEAAEDAGFSGDVIADNGFGPDVDPEAGAVLSVTEVNGVAILDGAPIMLPSGAVLTFRTDGTFDYDPAGAFDALAAGAFGADSFTYTLSDEVGATSQATADISIAGTDDAPVAVNDAPVAANDAFETTETTGFSGDVTADNGFGADADPNTGDVLSVIEVNGAPVVDGAPIMLPSGAVLTFRTDGTFDYDPAGAFDALAAGAFGADSFTYTLSDEVGATSQATADISIAGIDDAPVAVNDAPVAANDAFETTETTGFSGDVTADNGFGADADPNTGDVLSVIEVNGAPIVDGAPIMLPSGAVLTFRTDGTFDYDPAGAFDALVAGAFGADSFTYTLSDGAGGLSAATVDVGVEGVNEAPVAQDDVFTLPENSAISGNFFADNGQGQDTDANGDALSIVQIADLILSQDNAPISVTLGSGAEVTFSSDGEFAYEAGAAFDALAVGEVATDQFSYLVSDQQGGFGEAIATFTVTGVNDMPLARDDTFSTDEDTAIGGLFLLADNGSGVDADEDGGILSLVSIEGIDVGAGDAVLLASGAQVSVGEDGDIAYDPNSAFEDLERGEVASDSFVYQISDGQGGTSDATANVEITGVSDVLFGTAESDILEGTSEADDIRALDGGDFVSGFGGDDVIDGGAGDDRARGGLGEDSITGGEGNDALFGESGDDVLVGGDGADRLRGQRGDDHLFGGDGDDVLAGARGEDTLVGGDGADTLAGGGDNDRLRGQAGDDKLGGSRGDDMLLGGQGGDRIRGGGGDDTLIGGGDDDTLIGGAGDDMFQFAANDGSDIIRRFQQDLDLIEITSDGVGFDDLSIVQQGANVSISFGATEMLVTGQSRADFGEEDFIFLL